MDDDLTALNERSETGSETEQVGSEHERTTAKLSVVLGTAAECVTV